MWLHDVGTDEIRLTKAIPVSVETEGAHYNAHAKGLDCHGTGMAPESAIRDLKAHVLRTAIRLYATRDNLEPSRSDERQRPLFAKNFRAVAVEEALSDH